jgi:hypothetical protein
MITKERLRRDLGILAAFLAGLPVRIFLGGFKRSRSISQGKCTSVDNQLIWTESALVRLGSDVGPPQNGSPQSKTRRCHNCAS